MGRVTTHPDIHGTEVYSQQGKNLGEMTKPQQRWWRTNRIIIAFGLLLCTALAVGGAYLLGLLDQAGLLH